ncbi:LacI family DNA-binding transcriptional regulator [Actinomycetes bacterium KLBMP 9759]
MDGAMGRVTLKTVAEKVGVSSMTVSNAFSRPDQLSAQLRERILAAAAELGYAGPDPAARTLARGTTGTVGILLTESLKHAFTDEISTAFLAAIADELTPSGFALTLLPATEPGPIVPARDVALDGALVYSCRTDSPALDWLRRRGLPLVFVDQAPMTGVPSVNIDDRGGARAAAQHLVDLGHRRVGLLTVGDEESTTRANDWHSSRERRLGWLDALEPVGATVTQAQAKHCNHDEGYELARKILTRDRPTALLCFSDAFAAGAVLAAEDLGLSVPGDLSIVGFDDNPLATRLRPALTTIDQDVTGKGRAAAKALTDAVRRHREGAPAKVRHLTLPTRLVVRDSTAAAPA